MKRIIWGVAVLLAAGAVWADVELNAVFSDHMVLQRNLPVKVYGTAAADEVVSVSFAGQTVAATADADGMWQVELAPMPAAAAPRALRVSGFKSQVSCSDVLVGDVWLCTGQSNMAGTLESYVNYRGGLFAEFKGVPGDYRNEMIRLFTVGTAAEDVPQRNIRVKNSWAVCDPQHALAFSCTGYFFGKHLQPEIGVPLGLIQCAYGGTGLESWLPRDTMQSNATARRIYLDPYQKSAKIFPARQAQYKKRLAAWQAQKKGRKPQPPMGPKHIKRPAALYNAMLHPLHRLAVKGVIWYQGENEANRGYAAEYQTTFPLLINTWRERWGQEFPFIFVQLAGYKPVAVQPVDTSWARLRESQLQTAAAVPKTGMAVAIDSGLTRNIHPPYKERVGQRLAAQALATAYGKKGVAQGPMLEAQQFERGRAVLKFKHAGSGLAVQRMVMDAYGAAPFRLSADELKGFTLAGADRVFHPAAATVEGKDTVILSAPAVKHPVAVRYAWADFPLCNLYNKEGFAASPFRTDNWPMDGK